MLQAEGVFIPPPKAGIKLAWIAHGYAELGRKIIGDRGECATAKLIYAVDALDNLSTFLSFADQKAGEMPTASDGLAEALILAGMVAQADVLLAAAERGDFALADEALWRTERSQLGAAKANAAQSSWYEFAGQDWSGRRREEPRRLFKELDAETADAVNAEFGTPGRKVVTPEAVGKARLRHPKLFGIEDALPVGPPKPAIR